MKKLHKLVVFGLLILSSLNIMSKGPNKHRVMVINDTGFDIYVDPNTGSSKTIKKGESGCMVAPHSGDKLTSLKVCSQMARDWYSVKETTAHAQGKTVSYADKNSYNNQRKNVSVKNHNVIVIHSGSITSSTPLAPGADVYSGEKDYLAKNPTKQNRIIKCGNLDKY